jgi:RTA1 like protein
MYIMVAGLSFQVASIVLFILLALDYHLCMGSAADREEQSKIFIVKDAKARINHHRHPHPMLLPRYRLEQEMGRSADQHRCQFHCSKSSVRRAFLLNIWIGADEA